MVKKHIKRERLRIGVLMGGRSIEREVSFNSGRTICDHLDSYRYEILPLYQSSNGHLFILPWHFLHRGKTSDFEHRLLDEAQKIYWDELKERVDFVYSALHGKYAEDGTLQGILSLFEIPFLGSGILCGAICMNKALHRKVLSHNGILVPPGVVIQKLHIRNLLDKKISFSSIAIMLDAHALTFPVVVKPTLEGSSLGVSIVFSLEELEDAIISAALCDGSLLQDVLVEKKLEGMEFVSIALEERNGSWRSLPVTEIVYNEGAHFFDYRQKYMPGLASKITPARCSEENQKKIQEITQKITQLLEFKTVARIDGFLTTNGEIIIVDSQPITGMSPSTFLFDQAALAGMNHSDLINHFIEIDLARSGFIPSNLVLHLKNEDAKKDEDKMRIGVLFGGDSLEKEISFESGRNVCYKLSPTKYVVTPLFVTPEMELFPITHKELVKNTTRDILPLLKKNEKILWSELPQHFDFIFNALHGGKGENGVVQGSLEMLDISYNGSGIFASALCMDKYKTAQFLRAQGFDVPASILISKNEWTTHKQKVIETVCNTFKLPCIVKPFDDGCSNLVSKAITNEELVEQIDYFFLSNKLHVLIEEYVVGLELTCGVIGNETPQALPPSAPFAKSSVLSIEEKFLPGTGENQTPAPLSQATMQRVMAIMEEVFKVVQCSGYARIDCFYQDEKTSPTKKERVVIIEINTLPGLTPATCIFHQAAEIGLRPMEFIDTLVRLGVDRFANYKKAKLKAYKKKALQEVTPVL